jgi:hypothetical protein
MRTGKTLVLFSLILAFAFVGCKTEKQTYEGQGETQKEEAKITEAQQGRLIKSTPPPKIESSLERENLAKRLVRFNDPNKISYIYLVDFGKVMAFHAIKGKVSSVNSKLTTGEQIVKDPFAHHEGRSGKVVESPQLDGSYGTNGDAVFFFTTDDIYLEWNGAYMLSDQPLQLSTPPEMVRIIEDNPKTDTSDEEVSK